MANYSPSASVYSAAAQRNAMNRLLANPAVQAQRKTVAPTVSAAPSVSAQVQPVTPSYPTTPDMTMRGGILNPVLPPSGQQRETMRGGILNPVTPPSQRETYRVVNAGTDNSGMETMRGGILNPVTPPSQSQSRYPTTINDDGTMTIQGGILNPVTPPGYGNVGGGSFADFDFTFPSFTGGESLADIYAAYEQQIRQLEQQQEAAAQKAYQSGISNLGRAYSQKINALKNNLNSLNSVLAKNYETNTGALRSAFDTNAGLLQSAYNGNVDRLNQDTANQLQQAYVNRMLSQRGLGEQLAASGLNGGATETAIAGLLNAYGNTRNSINANAQNSLADLARGYDSDIAGLSTAYDKDLAGLVTNYQSSLADAMNAYNSGIMDAEDYRNQYSMQLERDLANSINDSRNNMYGSLNQLAEQYAKWLAEQQALQAQLGSGDGGDGGSGGSGGGGGTGRSGGSGGSSGGNSGGSSGESSGSSLTDDDLARIASGMNGAGASYSQIVADLLGRGFDQNHITGVLDALGISDKKPSGSGGSGGSGGSKTPDKQKSAADDARNLYSQIGNNIGKMAEELAKKGYSPSEINQALTDLGFYGKTPNSR